MRPMVRFGFLQPRRNAGANIPVLSLLASFCLLGAITGCSFLPEPEAQAQPASEQENAPPAAETAVAETGSLEEALEYTGTTEPVRLVSLRPQAEGRLLNLSVDVGDVVTQGQVLGELDDRVLMLLLNQAEAELASLQSEVVQAQAEVNEALARVGQAEAELNQARADAERLQSLFESGAGTEQQAEQAQTAVQTAEQALRSAQEQVRTRQQAVAAAQGRVAAQQSAVSEEEERRQYSVLTSPITGVVLERVTEPGNLVQPGEEVLQLGDFSAVKVMVQVSELERGQISLRQSVQVRLDAFPEQTFRGEVVRISPAADPVARLIPIEIVLPNPEGQIGSGLLARVQFQSGQPDQVIVPEASLTEDEANAQSATLFVVEGEGEQAKAVARQVVLGDRANGKVVIRSGLQAGETYVVRSSKPLKDGQSVRLSILSETN